MLKEAKREMILYHASSVPWIDLSVYSWVGAAKPVTVESCTGSKIALISGMPIGRMQTIQIAMYAQCPVLCVLIDFLSYYDHAAA